MSYRAPGESYASRVRNELHAELIVDRIAKGDTLAQICRDLDIPRVVIYDWIKDDAEFAKRMDDAREAGFDAIAEEALRIADDGTNDFYEKESMSGLKTLGVDKDHIQRSKLRVETRLKLLAKWHPKRYGEKLEIESRNLSANRAISDDPVEAARQYREIMEGH